MHADDHKCGILPLSDSPNRANGSRRLARWTWPAWLLWGFDRVLRAARIFAFNHGYLIPGGGVACNATVERVAEGFMLLRFRRPAHLHWAPGQSAHLTMPTVSKFPFESHPFTIANADLPAAPAPTAEKEKEKSSAQRGKDDYEKFLDEMSDILGPGTGKS